MSQPKRAIIELTIEQISDFKMLRDGLVKGRETKYLNYDLPPSKREWSAFDKDRDIERQLEVVEKILEAFK